MGQRENCNEDYKIFRFTYKCKRAATRGAAFQEVVKAVLSTYLYICKHKQNYFNTKRIKIS